MSEFPDTRQSLLLRIQSFEDGDAWEQFASMYQPIIFRMARRRGLQDADACDLAQRVLLSVALSIRNWKKKDDHTRFRYWLRKVTRNAVINELTRQPFDRAAGGASLLQLSEEDFAKEDLRDFEDEYRRELFLQAIRIVRRDFDLTTWQAFELTVIEGLPISEVSVRLDKKTGAIYTARSRVTQRIRDAIRELESQES